MWLQVMHECSDIRHFTLTKQTSHEWEKWKTLTNNNADWVNGEGCFREGIWRKQSQFAVARPIRNENKSEQGVLSTCIVNISSAYRDTERYMNELKRVERLHNDSEKEKEDLKTQAQDTFRQ